VPFRDGELRSVYGVSDRALLRLGQSYAQSGQWEPSRATLAALVERFPQSPWAEEARYGIGWASQSQKQYDNAVAAYVEVTRRTAAEVAARAQFQIGQCRLEQQRPPDAIKAFQVVTLSYDYPEWRAAAMCQAAQAHVQASQAAEARRLWQRVVSEYPKTKWAETARQRLAEKK